MNVKKPFVLHGLIKQSEQIRVMIIFRTANSSSPLAGNSVNKTNYSYEISYRNMLREIMIQIYIIVVLWTHDGCIMT